MPTKPRKDYLGAPYPDRPMRPTTFLLPFLLLLPAAHLSAQTYWGMTSNGGTSGNGTIYTITESGTFTKKHDFYRVPGGTRSVN